MQNVPTLRIELRTFSLRNRRSTTELNRLFEQDWRVVKTDFLRFQVMPCIVPDKRLGALGSRSQLRRKGPTSASCAYKSW